MNELFTIIFSNLKNWGEKKTNKEWMFEKNCPNILETGKQVENFSYHPKQRSIKTHSWNHFSWRQDSEDISEDVGDILMTRCQMVKTNGSLG